MQLLGLQNLHWKHMMQLIKSLLVNNNNAAPSKIPNFIVCYFSSAFFINISMIYQMDIINEKISKYLPKVPILWLLAIRFAVIPAQKKL